MSTIPSSMQEVYELAASGRLDVEEIARHAEDLKKVAAAATVSYQQDKEAWRCDKFTKELKNMLVLAWAKEDNKPGSISLKELVRNSLNLINN